MPVKLAEYARKAATLPPRVVLRKASEKARRGMTAWYRARRDRRFTTYSRRFVPHPPVLINLVSRRVRQLNQGRAPLINTAAYGMRLGQGDIALIEIIEGKKLISKLKKGDEYEQNHQPT